MHTKEKLTTAKYSEWLGSLFGACFIAFALGLMLSDYLGFLTLPLLIVGILLHIWGMSKTYQRNK